MIFLFTDNHLDVPDSKSIMTAKADSIARFIYVIRPLCEVYELPTSSVHLYYDLEGMRIAFNRKASLFLNLRYFEAWRMFEFSWLDASKLIFVYQMTRTFRMAN